MYNHHETRGVAAGLKTCLHLKPSMFSFLSFLHFFTDDFIYLQATCTTTQTTNDVVPNHHEDGGVAAVAMALVVIIVVMPYY